MNRPLQKCGGLFRALIRPATNLAALPNNHFMQRLLFLLLPVLFACAGKKEQPITDAEATAYAKRVNAAVKAGDENAIDKMLDADLFAEEVVKAAGDDESTRGLKNGVKEGFQKQGLSRQILGNLGDDGSYEFVRQYQKDGVQHIIFRLFGEGGINYHDFTLVKFDDSIRAKDVYLYLSGENLSKTMGGLVDAMAKADDAGAMKVKDQAKALPEIRMLYQQKRFEDAKRRLDRLPEEMRQGKAMQLMNVLITAELDEGTYSRAMNEFERLYGGDPTVQLALFDNYFIKKDYNRLFKILDGIDKTVQDPVIDYYRAIVYSEKGDMDAAIGRLESVYKRLPSFQPAVLDLIANYLDQGKLEKAEPLVAAYKANKDFNQSKLRETMDLYPDAAAAMR